MGHSQEKERPKILVVHPRFGVLGGAEVTALQIIDYLLHTLKADVHLLTLEPVDLAGIEQKTGARLTGGALTTSLATCPVGVLRRHTTLFLLGLAFLHRHARQLAPAFDLCASTFNEVDFSVGGFQYVHHPVYAERKFLHRYNIIGTRTILDAAPVLNRAYRALVMRTAQASPEGFRRNWTLANSEFTRQLLSDAYGIQASVLYPGMLAEGGGGRILPWHERAFRFISVGRYSPDKNLLELVSAYSALHVMFPDAEFVIAGRSADEEYFRCIRRFAEERRVPVRLVRDLDKPALDELVRTSRFYVTAKAFEHFGIATLEAMNLGCIPFVPDSGGQREVVAPASLRYSSFDDLANKVKAVHDDAALREDLLAELRRDLPRFTKSRFIEGLDRFLRPLLRERQGE